MSQILEHASWIYPSEDIGEICPVFAGVQQTGAAVPLMVDTLLQILPSAADAVCRFEDGEEKAFD